MLSNGNQAVAHRSSGYFKRHYSRSLAADHNHVADVAQLASRSENFDV